MDWLMNGNDIPAWGYGLADGLDVLLNVMYLLVKVYISM